MSEDMSPEEKKARRYLMFLKEKRFCTTKARGCADSMSQCEYTTKEIQVQLIVRETNDEIKVKLATKQVKEKE